MGKIIKSEKGVVFQNLFLDMATGEIKSPVLTSNYEIIQVADSYFIKNRVCAAHRQYCELEITYAVYNEVFCATANTEMLVKKHDAYVSLLGDRHSLYTKSRSRYQTVAVNARSEEAGRLISAIAEKFKGEDRRIAHLPELSEHMTDIISEFLSPEKPFSKMRVDASITAILVSLARHTSHAERTQPIFSREDILPDILNYVDSEFLNIRSVDEVADRFGYSHSYLCRLFREKHGSTISKYLSEKRLGYAARGLAEGKTCIELAESLGYSNAANFTRAFKAHFGISPEEYKSRLSITV